jgi:hypothetical protein
VGFLDQLDISRWTLLHNSAIPNKFVLVEDKTMLPFLEG